MCGTQMASEGLPIPRREHDADNDDVLSGVDFLSVLMGSSLRRSHRETTTSTTLFNEPVTQPTLPVAVTTSPTEHLITSTSELKEQKTTVVRESRSTQTFLSPSMTTPLDVLRSTQFIPQSTSVYDSNQLLVDNNSNNSEDNNKKSSDSNDLNDGVVVAVHVSSSVGRTLINKIQETHIEDTTLREPTEAPVLTTVNPEKNVISSEEQPSIIAESNKSEFSVEESEPITTNSDLNSSEYVNNFANARALPRISSQSSFNSDYLAQELVSRDNGKTKLQPFHQTVIFHNHPRESGRARSVSYSTVIQAVPHSQANKNWEGEKLQLHDRQERHYDGTQASFANNFENIQNKPKINETGRFNSPSVAESNNYFVTTNPGHHNIEKNWEKPERAYQEPETSSIKTVLTTERNWEIPEKPYTPPSHHQQLPTVYGRPEQNYEVDESVSVVSNGRVHGVQPQNHQLKQAITTDQSNANGNGNNNSGKKDDNQKVGYVVEGRNYRKYRVEERTSDGFIVGEYGVVSHDDGSLRGVRYTADGTINPRLIYDALMKFLSL